MDLITLALARKYTDQTITKSIDLYELLKKTDLIEGSNIEIVDNLDGTITISGTGGGNGLQPSDIIGGDFVDIKENDGKVEISVDASLIDGVYADLNSHRSYSLIAGKFTSGDEDIFGAHGLRYSEEKKVFEQEEIEVHYNDQGWIEYWPTGNWSQIDLFGAGKIKTFQEEGFDQLNSDLEVVQEIINGNYNDGTIFIGDSLGSWGGFLQIFFRKEQITISWVRSYSSLLVATISKKDFANLDHIPWEKYLKVFEINLPFKDDSLNVDWDLVSEISEESFIKYVNGVNGKDSFFIFKSDFGNFFCNATKFYIEYGEPKLKVNLLFFGTYLNFETQEKKDFIYKIFIDYNKGDDPPEVERDIVVIPEPLEEYKGFVENEFALFDNLKQNKLISGSNIKTINGQNILGEGDIETPNVFGKKEVILSEIPSLCALYEPDSYIVKGSFIDWKFSDAPSCVIDFISMVEDDVGPDTELKINLDADISFSSDPSESTFSASKELIIFQKLSFFDEEVIPISCHRLVSGLKYDIAPDLNEEDLLEQEGYMKIEEDGLVWVYNDYEYGWEEEQNRITVYKHSLPNLINEYFEWDGLELTLKIDLDDLGLHNYDGVFISSIIIFDTEKNREVRIDFEKALEDFLEISWISDYSLSQEPSGAYLNIAEILFTSEETKDLFEEEIESYKLEIIISYN